MSATPAEEPGAIAAPSARVAFTEGSIGLPPGYEDRTTNVLVPANIQVQPNLSVARDTMNPGETLKAYVDRQLTLLKSQLAGHHLLERRAEQLGAPEAAALSGERIDARYRNGKLMVYQRQAAFEWSPGRIVVFSAARANGFGEAFEQLWAGWLGSFQQPGAERVEASGSQATGLPASPASPE